MTSSALRNGPPRRAVLVGGIGVRSAFGAGLPALTEGVLAGRPAFTPVDRFATAGYRTDRAATGPGSPRLADQLVAVLAEAGALSGPTDDPLHDREPEVLLALHGDRRAGPVATEVGDRTGLRPRVYTGACVAAATAVADAAALIAAGRRDRVVVAAGYLVEPDTFAVFDAGRALAADGAVRPFSLGRQGMLLGDAAVAVVLESAPALRRRGGTALARIAGWGRSGDAFHVCRPHPGGVGLARAVRSALGRAGTDAGAIGWVNANGAGSKLGDQAEAAALHELFPAGSPPVSSTKSVHGHALEASALLELAVTVGVLRAGSLPVNAGWQAADPDCALDLVLDRPRPAGPGPALTVNAAFGGANTALLVAPA
ncbi:beta-ketoacyl synthase N-terminal-like domain-containing protein [Streptomyces sp. TLI_171]|uniref:beta-ketoacyl synthase N-terminal-like domain-containing protein n=1 Tax=Streptomyces sp. TLI_171 TaxID=1938859 RepID=UPI000C176033|nr:beta-ketoacyl synthase N-terminal-like domain-containing protein [Streptomyces sp. TLI_171]RKE22659.1 3-oxoacyl-[acyl-carrier-protein] synthase II [Streptomyces sp. TLI_171]